MRVVNTDNFGGDYPNEKFVAGPLPKEDCEWIAADYNNRPGAEYSSRYYKVVPDDYILEPGFEP